MESGWNDIQPEPNGGILQKIQRPQRLNDNGQQILAGLFGHVCKLQILPSAAFGDLILLVQLCLVAPQGSQCG